MLNFIRLIVIAILLIPPFGLGILSLTDIPVPMPLFVVTVGASLLSVMLWAMLSARYSKLYQLAGVINKALERDKEQYDALVEPLQASAMPDDNVYQIGRASCRERV